MISFRRFCKRNNLPVMLHLNFSVCVSEVVFVADETAVFGTVAFVIICAVKVTFALNISVR